jgi:hypothetical protein
MDFAYLMGFRLERGQEEKSDNSVKMGYSDQQSWAIDSIFDNGYLIV